MPLSLPPVIPLQKEIIAMLQFFKTRSDYLAFVSALADAFAAGITFAKSGAPVYDADGEESQAYAMAFSQATDVTPVYPPEEYEQIYAEEKQNVSLLSEMLRDTEYAASSEEIAALLANLEKDYLTAMERWEQYISQNKESAEVT